MTAWEVYLFTRVDSIREFFVVISFFCGFGVGAYFLVRTIVSGVDDEDSRETENVKAFGKVIKIKIWIFVFLFSLLAATSVPTTKELAAIYLIPPITQNEDIKQIPKDTAKILRLKLDEWIESLDKKDK